MIGGGRDLDLGGGHPLTGRCPGTGEDLLLGIERDPVPTLVVLGINILQFPG